MAYDKNPQYFEGVIQLRNCSQEILDFVIYRFEKNEIGIAKIVKVSDGFDIYSASNKFSRKIGKMLVRQFGGELRETSRLFTKDKLTSKNVYRLTVYYKAPLIKKNDVVVLKDKIIQVTSLEKSSIKGTDLVTGKRITMPAKGAEVLEKKKVSVVRIKPFVEVMHPETFQPVEVENPKPLKLGQNVKVVEYKNKLFLV
ncbi:hypothetical protein KY316_02070 [Candidatus Woesearchaeota archaeon]|nr:hypothetical protein [Candidatus Woesearchaeota archaeon]